MPEIRTVPVLAASGAAGLNVTLSRQVRPGRTLVQSTFVAVNGPVVAMLVTVRLFAAPSFVTLTICVRGSPTRRVPKSVGLSMVAVVFAAATARMPRRNVTLFVAFVLLGIEEIGVEIENPFGNDDNDLPLEAFCETIRRNVEEMAGLSAEPFDKPQ